MGRLSPLAKFGFLMVGRSNIEFPRFHLFLDKEHGLSLHEVGPTGRNRNSMKGIPDLRLETELVRQHHHARKSDERPAFKWCNNTGGMRSTFFRLSFQNSGFPFTFGMVGGGQVVWKRSVGGSCLTGDKLPPNETGRTVHSYDTEPCYAHATVTW